MLPYALLMRGHEWGAVGTNKCKHHHVRLHNRIVYNSGACVLLSIIHLLRSLLTKSLQHSVLYFPVFLSNMPAKPASTAGKAPASTASKAPAKTTSETKAKKATKTSTSTDTDGKKKRRKTRKETYSSYIYKGTRFRPRSTRLVVRVLTFCLFQSSSRSIPILVSRTRLWRS